MPPALLLCFGPFRLDMANAQLWCETQPVRLTAKALQVLSYLAERPGQLVTKDELFEAVWPDTVVSDATLTSNIQAVRQVLGDDSRSPQYIETVHRRGFRFIALVAAPAAPVPSAEFRVPSQEERAGSQDSVDSRKENQKPVLSSSTSLRINSVEGANSDITEQAEGVRLKASEPPPSFPSSLEPVAYSLPQDSAPTTQSSVLVTQHSPSSRFTRSFVLAAVLLLTATILTVQYLSHSSLSPQSSALITQEAQLPLPDKPSLIVLPLVNLSNDPEQEYFSDGLTEVLSYGGRSKDALEAAAQALRLKSYIADDHLASVGAAYAVAGRYEEARGPLQHYLNRYPNILGTHLTLALVYSELGQEAEARAEAAEVLRINPHFSLELHQQRMPIKDPGVLERHIAALRKAGLK